ncbi:MAG: DNA-directed RNA polymerase subunit P [Candidatus Nanoarchaeia archaeon]
MKSYKCFDCDNIVKMEYLRKKVRCPKCGSRVLYKQRSAEAKIKAR